MIKTILHENTTYPPPPSLKQVVTGFKCLVAMFFITATSKSQTAATFTAADISVTNTITAGGAIRGQCITANDTMRAKEDIVAEKDLKVSGNVEVSSNVLVGQNISIGAQNDFISFGYTPATATSPSVFKLFPPSTGPSNPQNPGGPSSPDPTPNLACVLGLNYLASFPNAISIKQNLNNQTAGTGGNLVLGHTGAKAFIESEGGGAGPINHQGDLFVNATCNRNVNFFTQSTSGFGNTITNAVSINGKLNLTENMQIGIPSATNFLENSSKLFVQADVASNSNGLKIKHGSSGTYGVKVIEFNDAEKAFGVFKAPNSTLDGAERFSVQGDGKTLITTTNTDALNIADGNNANQINFKIKNTGATEINNVTSSLKAFTIKNTNENFLVYGNGQTHISTNAQIGFNSSAIQDNSARLHINLNPIPENPSQNGIKFTVNNNIAKLITVSNPNYATSPFTVLSDGRVQIGGELLTSSGYSLTVNGKVGAREIKVSIQNPWPDYVFEKNYKLQSLDLVQNYVKQNKHLPNIPSAEELKKEECGLDLAQMQGKQMEKIEEIYLYLFEMKKEIESLKKENTALKILNKK